MYLIYISAAAAVAVGIGFYLIGAGWILSPILALVVFAVVWILGARRLNKILTPAMMQVQNQVQGGHVRPALQTLEGLLPLGKWMPLLSGQLYAQMGVLAWHDAQRQRDKAKHEAEAVGYLEKAGHRAAEARMLLASIRYREGRVDEALKILATTEPFNRKHVLLHNLHAYLLNKEGRADEAIKVLNRLLTVSADDKTKDNLLRLQNGRKLNMRAFDMQWYALGFERPQQQMMGMPGAGGGGRGGRGPMQQPRKGFRQQPKRKK